MICASSKYPYLDSRAQRNDCDHNTEWHDRPDDVYIAIMGMTGSGKSSFIATCCPDAAGEIGHELESSIDRNSTMSCVA